MVKNLPTVQESQVQSLGREHPLEKGMAIHSSILAWGIPWTGEPGRIQSMGLQRVWQDWATNTFTFTLISAERWYLCFIFPYSSVFLFILCILLYYFLIIYWEFWQEILQGIFFFVFKLELKFQLMNSCLVFDNKILLK